MRRELKVILAIIAALAILSLNVYGETTLDREESWYQTVCSDPDTASQYTEDCKKYQAYLIEKANKDSKDANELQLELDKLREELAEAGALRQQLDEEIKAIESRINYFEGQIAIKEAEIQVQQAEIDSKQAEIDELDAFVVDIMRYQQSSIHFNSYVEFIMEADNLVDLLLRVSAINDINEYNSETINKLNGLITELNLIKAQLEIDKQSLVELLTSVEAEKQTIVVKRNQQAEIENLLRGQEAEFEAQLNKYFENLDDYQSLLNSVAYGLDEQPTTVGWTKPVASGYRVSAEAWYYPASFGGGVHLGVDYAAAVGTTIRAAGNGVIIASANSCPTTGYLGSSCGSPGSGGGGNQVYLLTNIQGSLYVVKYLHMKKDTPISTGTLVEAGQKIGEVGSSGNSTGAHVHVEIFYVGKMTYTEFLNSWRGDLAFGAGWGSNALNYRCESNGNKAPCRLKPQDYLGY